MRRALIVLALLLAASEARAWKPTTHVFLAEVAVRDALDDGRVTIRDLGAGRDLSYAVDPQALEALRTGRAQYHAGVLGPDAYPDILTGQQVIHPDGSETGVPGGSDAWLRHVWENFGATPQQRAFRLGFLTHAAGDVYGHTFINTFTGAPFTVTPPTNAIKHVVLEGYIDKRLPIGDAPDGFFKASIAGLEDRIYRTMIDARPGTPLDRRLLPAGKQSTAASVPRIFSTLRQSLERDIASYYAHKKDLQRRIKACKPLDFSCSAVALGIELGAYMTLNAAPTTYKEYWRADIDSGLGAWPATSHAVALALFFNPDRRTKTDEADAILTRYVQRHLLSMAGAPDFVGLSAEAIGKIVDAVTPDFLLAPIRQLKEDLLNAMLVSAIGMTKDQLQGYMTQPDRYFDEVMGQGAGEHVTLQRFNAESLKISDPAYSDPAETFDWQDLPAAYDTVVLSKLILLPLSEIDRLVADLGGTARLGAPNVMLGFASTLDGSRQWRSGLVLARDCAVYDRVLQKLPGGSGC